MPEGAGEGASSTEHEGAEQEDGAGKGANSTEHEGTEREEAALEDEGAGGGEREGAEGEDACGCDGSEPEASKPKVYSVEAVFNEERQGRVPEAAPWQKIPS